MNSQHENDLACPALAGKNLAQVLQLAAEGHPGHGIGFIDGQGAETFLTYAEIRAQAELLLAGLRKRGLRAGDQVVFQLSRNEEFVPLFWACMLGGLVPVPLNVPLFLHAGDEAYRKLGRIRPGLGRHLVIAEGELAAAAEQDSGADNPYFQAVVFASLAAEPGGEPWHDADPGELALLMFSSGSTGAPKGVMLTHRNILSNVAQIGTGADLVPEDVSLNWLPLTHDMGLILFHIVNVAVGMDQYLMPSFDFIRNPNLFLSKIGSHRVTITGCPNFAITHLLRNADRDGCDLSSVRMIMNGAEPISADITRKFLRHFACVGLGPQVMVPAYGLAEASVNATAMLQPNAGPEVLCDAFSADRKIFLSQARIEPSDLDPIEFVNLGRPFPGIALKVVDEAGSTLPDFRVGRILLQGPNVSAGYYGDNEANAGLFLDGWLNTGDLGFLRDGHLYITGREKDVIFINGQNFYSHDIEQDIMDLKPAGIRDAVACGYNEDRAGEERICVFLESRKKPSELIGEIARIQVGLVRRMGFPVESFAVVSRIPMTTSGKKQRFMLRDRILSGKLDAGLLEMRALLAKHQRAAFSGPIGETEALVLGIWKTVLDKEDIGAEDSFFGSGGSSVTVMTFLGRIEKATGAGLPVSAVFEAPTIRQFSRLLRDVLVPSRLPEAVKRGSPERNGAIGNGSLAVIGIGCRFPGGVRTPEAFWELLRNGASGVSEVPGDRWDMDLFFDADPDSPGKMYSRHGSFLDEVDDFDAAFFGISPGEAESMDPQQRILMEVSHDALANAGQTLTNVKGSRTSVFIGQMNRDFQTLSAGMGPLDAHSATGTSASASAGRLSYFFDLRGPSLVVDTACSSSLVAIHLAGRSLLSGESDMALAGGVNLILAPEGTIASCRTRFLAADGQCKTFDTRADGYVRGEGCGVVILKRLEDAVAAGDRILAVVRGSAVNQDGRSGSLTAPNPAAQVEVVRSALEAASASPSEVGLIETHGSGTPLGDAIEIQALGRVYGGVPAPAGVRWIGSVKTNLGHLESAAGIAGFIKAVLCLREGTVAPHTNFRELNPHLDLAGSFMRIPLAPEPLAVRDPGFLAGISSFGFTGTNAHVILAPAPQLSASPSPRSRQLLVFSARTETAVEQAGRDLADFLDKHPVCDMADVAYTLQAGRDRLKHRKMLVCDGAADAVKALRTMHPSRVGKDSQGLESRPVTFMLSGLGDQYLDMAVGLYRQEAAFKADIDECLAILAGMTGIDFITAMFPSLRGMEAGGSEGGKKLPSSALPISGGQDQGEAKSLIRRTDIAHPSLFMVGYALARQWMRWGIVPDSLIGYSLGEYVAACIAGVFSLKDALFLVLKRAELIQGLEGGAMLAVSLPRLELLQLLPAECWVSLDNGPTLTVVSGTEKAIEELTGKLQKAEAMCKRLQATHPFHCELLRPMAGEMGKLFAGIACGAPRIPILSNLTGAWLKDSEAADPGYWIEHSCGQVRFREGIATLQGDAGRVFLEIGPGQTLTSIVFQNLPADQKSPPLILSSLPNQYTRIPDAEFIATTLGKLWLSGCVPDWSGYHRGGPRQLLDLPGYPFLRQKFRRAAPRLSIGSAAGLPAAEGNTMPRGYTGGERRDVPAMMSDFNVPRRPDMDDWFYRPDWRALDRKERITPQSEASRAPWLLFLDEQGVGRALADLLAAAGSGVIMVERGNSFAGRDGGNFSVNPESREDFRRLFLELSRSERGMPEQVVYLASLRSNAFAETDGAALVTSQESAFFAPLLLVQELGKAQGAGRRLTLVTQGAFAVNGPAFHPDQALVAGFCRVVPKEFAGLACRSLDFPSATESADDSSLKAREIFRELQSGDGDLFVAFRSGKRWVQDFIPCVLPSRPEAPSLLRRGGVYLITGGLGGLGLALAEFLGASQGAKLILLGRQALPERGGWDAWLTAHGEDDPVSRRIVKLMALEKAGAEVMAVAADVGDRDQMAAAIRQAKARFGSLDGVFHAAGVPGSGLIHSKSRDGAAQVLRAKVQGTVVLGEVLRAEPLRFMVLFSSITAITGMFGQIDYSAGNAFMDSYAAWKNGRQGIRAMSINWGEWQWNGWEEGLQGLGPDLRDFFRENRKLNGITFAEGMDALGRLLDADPGPQIVVSPQPLPILMEKLKGLTVSLIASGMPSATAVESRDGGGYGRPELGTVFVPATQDLESRVAAIWQACIRIDRVGLHDNFFELGGNSIIGIRIITETNREFGTSLPEVALYEFPTVGSLSAHLRGSAATGRRPEPAVPSVPQESSGPERGDIAIIGMAGRFPGAADTEAFWRNLCEGVESITYFTDQELLDDGVDPALLSRPEYVKAKPILDGVELFDARFFGLSPREAELLSPQHRLFLETSWQCLENAGYDPERYPGNVGVFASTNLPTYMLDLLADPELDGFQTVLGNDKDSLPTLTSYKLNLKGPSVAVQTYCSSSAVGIFMACESIRQGQCGMAIAGGVSVQLPRKSGYLYQKDGMFSADGHLRAFDGKATGMILGSGVGVVALKSLTQARLDGDNVHAIIRGAAMNNDGALKAGYSAPSLTAQAAVIRQAMAEAAVDPESIGYLESHGTGTSLGDSIEFSAMSRAFPKPQARSGYCAMGSVKTNVGHLDTASGVTGVIKTALALKYGKIPPSLHFEKSGPRIDFTNSPFYMNTRLSPWRTDCGTRRAGVNSFGMGGTNVHLVLEEPGAGPDRAPEPPRPWELLILSAKNPAALEAATANIAGFLENHPEANLADTAFTLQVGRGQFPFRRFILAAGDGKPRESAPGHKRDGHVALQAPRLALWFGRLDAGLKGIFQDIYAQEPAFRSHVDQGLSTVDGLAGFDAARLRENLAEVPRMDGFAAADAEAFLWFHAFARLLKDWGVAWDSAASFIFPDSLSACLAGRISLAQALGEVAGASGRTGRDDSWQAESAPSGTSADTLTICVGEPGSAPARSVSTPEGRTLLLRASIHATRDGSAGMEALWLLAGELWLQGAALDWAALHRPFRRKRIELPTYPFQREYFWYQNGGFGRPGLACQTAASRLAFDQWFHQVSWDREQAFHLSREPEQAAKGCCILFRNASSLGARTAEHAARMGFQVISVFPGECLKAFPDGDWALNPESEENCAEFFKTLSQQGIVPEQILFLWGLADDPGAEGSGVGSGFAMFRILIHLVRTHQSRYPGQSLRMLVAVEAVYDVLGDEALIPENASILGPCLVIPQEYPQVRMKSLEVDAGAMHDALKQDFFSAALVQSALEDGGETRIAMRGRHRWTPRYVPIRLAGADGLLKEGGTYFITGGLGKIGKHLAAMLAREYGANVILTGRTELPPRTAWESILSRGGESVPVIARIRDLLKLEGLRGRVEYQAADSADAVSMRRVWDGARKRYGRIDGVIHAAGLVDPIAFPPIQDWTEPNYLAHSASKVAGIASLEALIADQEPDFVLLFSSLASILGGLGFASYAAVNLHMDALCRAKNKSGRLPWYCVNWDTWKFPGDVLTGMSGNANDFFLTPEEGWDITKRVLVANGPRQIVVSTGDLGARIRQWVGLERDKGDSGKPRVFHPRPQLPTEYAAPETDPEKIIADIWKDFLGIEGIGIYDNFFQLGGHSLLGTQLVSRLRKIFSVQIPLSVLFEKSTVSGLAEFIEEQVLSEIEEMTDEQVKRISELR